MADTRDITKWDGAIGPQSAEDPIYFELQTDGDTVRLVGPSPGQLHEYELTEFEALVNDGEWILATHDPDTGEYHTPDDTNSY